MYNALLDAFCNELVHMALVISFVVDKISKFSRWQILDTD